MIGRRNGKLLYEAGDSLACRVHKEKDEDIVLEGIKQFERIMGINPMLEQDVDQDLLSGLDFKNKEKRVDILGINSSFGINLLAIQDRVREESKIFGQISIVSMKKKPMSAILRQLPKRVDSSLIGIKTLTNVSRMLGLIIS